MGLTPGVSGWAPAVPPWRPGSAKARNPFSVTRDRWQFEGLARGTATEILKTDDALLENYPPLMAPITKMVLPSGAGVSRPFRNLVFSSFRKTFTC